jgi:uncharacterized protein
MSDTAWTLTGEDVEHIAVGAGVLGTGGGGNPYLGKLVVQLAIRDGARITIIPPDAVGDDDLLISVSGMGAPTVSIEKLTRGSEATAAFQAMERYLNEQARAVVCGEIGGGNSMTPLEVAARVGLPVIDADPMGRAFPELQMDTFNIGGVSTTPSALADEKGNVLILAATRDPLWTERLGRVITVAMGGSAGLAMPVLRGRQLKETGIWGSYTLAHRIGVAVRRAQREKVRIETALAPLGTRLLFRGKIVDIKRETTGGFARGMAIIHGFEDDTGSVLRVAIQNENLVAWRDERVLITVPDLICMVDDDSGESIGTEVLRYGLRVCVLAFAADPKLTTPAGLAVVGPRAFGYEMEYRPFASLDGGHDAAAAGTDGRVPA